VNTSGDRLLDDRWLNNRLVRAREAAARVSDPEIPSLTLEDLGILRAVDIEGDRVVVTVVPTYTGCPATDAIVDDVRAALDAAGVAPFEVRIALTPAWSSDWITAEGRTKLLHAGIAPPACLGPSRIEQASSSVIRFTPHPRQREQAEPACPRCGSAQTELLSEYGSTACKSLYRCRACAEPFDYFKPY